MTYDDYGDAVASGPNYAQGRLVKVEENTDSDAATEVIHEFAYDHLGNVRVKQVEIDGLTGDRTLEYVHDLAGRVTRLIYPDGTQARDAFTTLLPVFRYPAKPAMVVSQKVQQDGSLSRNGRCQQARNRPKHGTVISNAFARMPAMTYITGLYH